jgi:hypothetical protein
MKPTIKRVAETVSCSAGTVPTQVFSSAEPLILKGLIEEWPMVNKGRESAILAAEYIARFDRNIPLTVYEGKPENKGRIFYNDDFTGFNFERTRKTLEQVLGKLFALEPSEINPTYYVVSTMIDHWLPGFRSENDIVLDGRESLVSIWMGNQSRIAAHYDFPNNIACCVAGRRTVTLFPPDQADNLYVGPLEFTPSGQPISLVDSSEPDIDQFPKYQQALDSSYRIELEAGDALFIPSMWWHHIEAKSDFNVLVNYWWRSTPSYLGSPMNALHHTIMSLSGLPLEQREVWRDIFEKYVFSADAADTEHIPEHARGILSGVDESSAKAIRAQLVKFLK